LTIQSFVTGQLVVAFDFYPGTPVHLKGHGGDLIELPTLPSDMDALSKTLDTIDIEAIATSIEDAVHGFEDLVNSPELKASISTLNLALKDYRRLAVNLNNRASQLSGELSDTLAETRHLIRTTDGHIPPVAAGITATTDELRKTIAGVNAAIPPVLTSAEATLANLQHLSDPDSALLYRLEEALTESQKAFRALALLADYLGRHPEALLQGKPAVKEER
jgi:paraquat-inducible protein B